MVSKAELIDQIAKRSGLSKKHSQQVLTAITDIVTDRLCLGEDVQIRGFGSFCRPGEGRRRVRFRPAGRLRELVGNGDNPD